MTKLHRNSAPFAQAAIGLVLVCTGVKGQDRPSAAPAATQVASSASLTLKIREDVIGEMPPGSKMEIARSSESHIAWVEKKGGDRVVKLDGKQVGGVYDDVSYLRFSSDQQHLAFTAKRRSKWVLVVDGRERTKEYGRLTAPNLSPNAKLYAVSACLGKKCRLVVNGEEVGPEFEDISAPAFTSNGEHYGYFGRRNKKWILQLDGKEYGSEMDDFATWRLSPDAKHVAVAALIDKSWTWVVNGVPGPVFDVISNIAFSSDYRHFAYGGTDAKFGIAKNKTRGAMVQDGKIIGEYQGRGFGGGLLGAFAGDVSNIATGVKGMTVDFHGVSDPDYTPEGKLVYAARRGDDDVVVITDGAPGPTFEDIVSPISLSDDGKHISYIVKQGDLFVEVRDHRPGASFPGKRASSYVARLLTSLDGQNLAYEIVRCGYWVTGRCLRRIVINGQSCPEYDALGISDLSFSQGARSYHYNVIGAEGSRDRVVFNGLETRLYETVFRGSVDLIDDQTIEFVAQDCQRFLRVTASIEESKQ